MVKVPSAIGNQPYIRSIQTWGDTIAVLTERYLREQQRFMSALFLIDPINQRFVPFAEKSCHAVHDIAASADGRYLLCEEQDGTGIFAYKSVYEQPHTWERCSESLVGNAVRVTVTNDTLIAVSDQEIYIQDATRVTRLPLPPLLTESPVTAPTTLELVDSWLYLGYDHGEWGGGLYRFPLQTPAAIERIFDGNVRKLVRDPHRSAVWMLSGLAHLSLYMMQISHIGLQHHDVLWGEYGIITGTKRGIVYQREPSDIIPRYQLPHASPVWALCLTTHDTPLLLASQVGIIEGQLDTVSGKAGQQVVYPLSASNRLVMEASVDMVMARNEDIFVATRSYGVFRLYKEEKGYNIEQYVFER